MKIKSLIALTLCLAVLALAGCGSSSSDNTPTATQGTQPALSTVINGLASKGPINTGTVKVFAVRDGVTDTSVPIAQGTTDANGNFTVDAGGFSGPVVVEVTGGSFTDEVSGTQVTLKTKMRTMVASTETGTTNTVAVTPLTELAAKRTETHASITPDVINESNKNVGATFNLADIVTTLPVASGTAEQKKHAAACGSISQLVNDSKHAGESLDDALTRVMGEMETEMENTGGLSGDSINKINTAVTEFNSGKNQGGSIAPNATPTGGVLKISTAGANGMGALDMTVNLPSGVTVNVANTTTGEAAAGAVTSSGAAAAGTQTAAKVAGGTSSQVVIGMINSTGFNAGECVTIDFNVPAGTKFPAATDFAITGVTAKDTNAKLINGVTAAPKSVATM